MAKRGKDRSHCEEFIQSAVAEHLRLRNPNLLWWHTPNGGWRNPREARRLKAMGVLPGVADILAFHGGEFFALELKSPKGKQSDNQIHFGAAVIRQHGNYYCAYGLDDALAALESWGLLPGWVTETERIERAGE